MASLILPRQIKFKVVTLDDLKSIAEIFTDETRKDPNCSLIVQIGFFDDSYAIENDSSIFNRVDIISRPFRTVKFQMDRKDAAKVASLEMTHGFENNQSIIKGNDEGWVRQLDAKIASLIENMEPQIFGKWLNVVVITCYFLLIFLFCFFTARSWAYAYPFLSEYFGWRKDVSTITHYFFGFLAGGLPAHGFAQLIASSIGNRLPYVDLCVGKIALRRQARKRAIMSYFLIGIITPIGLEILLRIAIPYL